MITGIVKPSREPVIRLKFRGTNGMVADLEAVIDTGFSEYVSLPQNWIVALALTLRGADIVTLADGSNISMDFYDCIVAWDGQDRQIRIYSAEGSPLVGMAMLEDYRLIIDGKISGLVTIAYNP